MKNRSLGDSAACEPELRHIGDTITLLELFIYRSQRGLAQLARHTKILTEALHAIHLLCK